MKVFTKKGILQKIIIAILLVFCINFIVPTYSHADIGGVLLSPFIDFFCSIGDVCINIMQLLMTGEWGSSGTGNFSINVFLMLSDEYYSNPLVYKEGNEDEVSDANRVNPDEDFDKGWFNASDKYHIPVATYSPEQIFAGQVSGLDINFINPNYEDGSAATLQKTISSWYVALRNLATVGLLCVLVYVGIRIMLSSTAGDKAKYKQMFTDWLIALCILFFLHYIMSFVLTLTESIVSAIGGDASHSISVYDETAGKTFSTNLLGLARFKTQYKDLGMKLTYLAFYMALVVYTAIFTWHYLKRLLMMAFLTIIAPMVALTYPIDKLGDGKAQAFNKWLKEYIYNALIQPFHLIIYTVFVSSAMDLVESNMLYALACMGFVLFAEKFLKKMFGFDNAPLGTMGALTGFTAGSLTSKFLGGKGGSSKLPIQGGNNKVPENKPPIYKRHHGTDGIIGPNNELQSGREKENTLKGEGTNINDNERQNLESGELTDEEDKEYNSLKNELDNTDYNDMYMNPDKYADKQARYDELEKKRLGEDEKKDKEENQELTKPESSMYHGKENMEHMKRGINNLVSAHGGGKRIAIKGAKTLGRAAKFVGRTGMTIAGTAAGAGIGLASGKGISGVIAGAAAGKAIGNNMGRKITELPENAVGGAMKLGKGIAEAGRKTIDTFNGNTNLQDAAQAKAFMKSETTEKFIRDKFTVEHNGTAPTRQELKAEKEKLQPYADEGMTDIEQIYRAKKAEKFGVDSHEAAKIALLAQDRKITSNILGDEREYKTRKEDFTQEFIDKGLSPEQADKKADYILNVMKAQVGQKHNLGKQASVKTVSNINSQGQDINAGKPRTKPQNNKPSTKKPKK